MLPHAHEHTHTHMNTHTSRLHCGTSMSTLIHLSTLSALPTFPSYAPRVALLPYLPLAPGAGNIFATFDIFNAARHGVKVYGKGTHTRTHTH